MYVSTTLRHAHAYAYFECAALAALRQQHADLFTSRTDTMRSFFGQQDNLGVLNYVINCLDHMDI